jgi:hypothetical protein
MPPRYIPIAVLVSCLGSAFGQNALTVGAPGNSQQQPSRSAARRTFAGTVINSVTGEPIRRALVRINGPEARVGFTAPDGRFEISNVPEGQIFVTAQKPGFFEEGTGSPGPSFQRPNPLVMLGSGTSEVVLKLAPAAKIRGHALDKAGEPIEGLVVQLHARVIIEGRTQWQQRGQGFTDDAGVYVIENVMPGSYAVGSFSLPVSPVPAPGSVTTGATRSEVYPRKYYPDAPDLSSAQLVDLKAGQELPLDFALSAVPAFRLSGVVSGARDFFQVFCEDAAGEMLSRGARVDFRTGRFSIESVPPGSWTIRAVSHQGQDSALQADQSVEVGSSDINGLALSLQSLPSIPVHVQNQPEGQNVMVMLAPVAATNQTRRFDAYRERGDPANPLALHSIPPGSYQVSTKVLSNSACLDSVLSGSVDLSRNNLTVLSGSQPAPIEIALRNDCATISGTVNSSSGQASGNFILLISDSSPASPQLFQTRADGKFSLPNLTPGSYRLFALNDVSDLEYANPEALRDFTGQEVTAGPNEKTSVQLNLITREK